jgi:hypothetical protein
MFLVRANLTERRVRHLSWRAYFPHIVSRASARFSLSWGGCTSCPLSTANSVGVTAPSLAAASDVVSEWQRRAVCRRRRRKNLADGVGESQRDW